MKKACAFESCVCPSREKPRTIDVVGHGSCDWGSPGGRKRAGCAALGLDLSQDISPRTQPMPRTTLPGRGRVPVKDRRQESIEMVGWLTNCARRRVLSSPNQARLGGAITEPTGKLPCSPVKTGTPASRQEVQMH